MGVRSGVCFNCEGRGWVSNGDIEDGRMTGRVRCATCHGERVVAWTALEDEVHRLIAIFNGEGQKEAR